MVALSLPSYFGHVVLSLLLRRILNTFGCIISFGSRIYCWSLQRSNIASELAFSGEKDSPSVFLVLAGLFPLLLFRDVLYLG